MLFRSRLTDFLTAQAARHEAASATAPGANAPGSLKDVARRKALADLCHMLLCSNEFAYVD